MFNLKARTPRKTPNRIRVAPPPGGQSVRDWLNLKVEVINDQFHPEFKVRAGAKGRVVASPRGGSGLVVRFPGGRELRGLTEQHVRVVGPAALAMSG